MKTYDKEQLKEIAVDVFNRYPKAQKLAITVDGQAFIVDESEMAAKNHSINNRHKKELEIVRFTRDEVIKVESEDKTEDKTEAPKKTAKLLIETITGAETVEAVEALRDAEIAGEKRVSVLTACEKRIADLKPAE